MLATLPLRFANVSTWGQASPGSLCTQPPPTLRGVSAAWQHRAAQNESPQSSAPPSCELLGARRIPCVSRPRRPERALSTWRHAMPAFFCPKRVVSSSTSTLIGGRLLGHPTGPQQDSSSTSSVAGDEINGGLAIQGMKRMPAARRSVEPILSIDSGGVREDVGAER